MTEWQPIETAPKDGTAILLALTQDYYSGGRVKEGFCDELSGDWYLANDSCSCCYYPLSDDNPPTHWRPLPDPPAE